MRINKLILVFILLMLTGCTSKEKPVDVNDSNPTEEIEETIVAEAEHTENETEKESISDETNGVVEEKKEKHDDNNFSSESNTRNSPKENQPSDPPKPKEPIHESKEPEIVPIEEPEPLIEPPKIEPVKPDPEPEKPVEEPKKEFVLPANWINGTEHNEYYLTTSEAAARVKALWEQRIDAGYSELYDAETSTTYAWVTWWE